MFKSRFSCSTTLVALGILTIACVMFLNTSLIQSARGDTGGAIADVSASDSAGNQASDSNSAVDTRLVSSPVTEQASINWLWFLMLLFIPLTGLVTYYYGVVKRV